MKFSKLSAKRLKNEVWDIFSKYIRLRDAIKTTGTHEYAKCYTCGKQNEIKRMDAGHYRSRQFNATLFDERNVHAQCKHCNGPNKGMPEAYARHLVEDYGEEMPNILYSLSRTSKHFSKSDLIVMRERYKVEIERLKQ